MSCEQAVVAWARQDLHSATKPGIPDWTLKVRCAPVTTAGRPRGKASVLRPRDLGGVLTY